MSIDNNWNNRNDSQYKNINKQYLYLLQKIIEKLFSWNETTNLRTI